MLVPHPRLLIPLGELDPRDAAPLSDAALTPYHAIKRSLHLLAPGSTAVVIGLDHMAVQILRALSPGEGDRRRSIEKLALAKEVGADEAVEAGEGAAEAIGGLTDGLGADLVLDNVGAEETITLGVAVARFASHVALVGLAGGSFQFARRLLFGQVRALPCSFIRCPP